MKNQFFETLVRGISGLAYRKYGGVKIALFIDEPCTTVRTVVYDAPSSIINTLTDVEKREREVFSKEYDITDVDFTDEYSVSRKLDTLTMDIEKEFQ